ncbi:ABC transporter substrate-binding protein [Rhodoplanes sp. Z2-YC6860]|uniref:ABC transporter substrate-binding protein n=1 Tax=Rhodoplanes sp. Z2-YC6860 TaxID=674703 RepID=UPI00078B50C7|nr:ABC transporter substrate-binding protein [Rhodoplanes sp. Z2-YC6860]AMN41381.1 ABC transporter substrate-binding protein [Rhodoplanes sp. Z2-YC6860]
MRFVFPRLSVLALAAISFAMSSPGHAETTLKFGVAAVNEGLLPLRVASDQGLLKAEGITAEFVDFRGGGPAVQAFAGGGVDFCICAADHVLRLSNRGLDARIIVGLDEHHSYALIAKADSPLTDFKSLKGKRIGVTSPGSFTDNTVRWEIKKAGLQAERDFQIISAGGGASMRAAIETNQVDAGVVVTTEVADYLRTGKFKIVVDWRPTRYAALVVIGRQRWADANPALAKGLVRAVGKAARIIQTDTATTAKSVKLLYPNFDDAHATEVAEAARKRLSKDGSVSPEAFANMTEIVLLSDSSLKKVNQADVDLQAKLK